MNYIVLFIKDKNKSNILIDFLKGLLGPINILEEDNNIIIKYHQNNEIIFEDITKIIVNDFYINLTLLEVNSENIEYVYYLINLYNNLEETYNYLNDKELITISSKCTNELVKKEILKEYYNNKEMLNLIKVFFESNLNTTITAKKLYLHRNTVINKIDKFINTTNYNIKVFKNAYIIYQLIK